ncbi:FGGY family carbohydrate kinase [Consotaella aegiceratis]|uniref:FGGY family carbohydrate kinase n=1 Tax=Consotaella aegiceratis TaxID=3097961 RepID=UPI002F3FBCE7
MSGFVLAIDQGTTNSKALLIGGDGSIAASGSAPVTIRYPQPGWVEASGLDLWKSVEAAVSECLSQASGAAIAAIGISNQRESILLWDRRSGEPVGPCVIWQCRRSTDRLAQLHSPETETLVLGQTGLSLDPLFPAAKLGWLLDHLPEARPLADAGHLCAGTIDSWLLFNLTGGRSFATDASNASRTQLFDIGRQRWSEELCALFSVPSAILPDVLDSDAVFGETAGGVLPAGIPIRAMIGDSHAALFGHGVRAPGTTKATYGTGSSLMTLTDTPVVSRNGLSTTVGWRRGGAVSYALEGNITVSGQAAAWAAKTLGLAGAEALTDLALTVPDSGGVHFVPALAGLGAPYWDPQARGLFAGLSLSSEPEHLARASLEAIAFQVRDVFAAIERDLGAVMQQLSADGGASGSAFLMQTQADLLGRPVVTGSVKELSAIGAATMAGVAAGLWDDDEAAQLFAAEQRRYEPQLSDEARRDSVEGWLDAVERARSKH